VRQAFVLTALLGLAACQSAPPRLPVEVLLGDHPVHTYVDSPLARSALLAPDDPGVRGRIDSALSALRGQGPTREVLSRLARETSVDFAALMLQHHIEDQPENRRLQGRLDRQLARPVRPSLPGLRILLVPGWAYRSNPHTGADLAGPLRALRQAGYAADRIETDQGGSVEENAALISAAIRHYSARADRILLVSASKAGAEVGQALGALLGCPETRAVLAWINAAGVLQGTPLIEQAQASPARPLTQLSLWLSGLDPAALASLSSRRGRARFANWRLPEHVLAVNYIGIPLSGTVTRMAQARYLALRAEGPNDGLTLLADALVPGGLTLVAPGRDHFLDGADMDRMAVALAGAVVEQALARPGSPACAPSQAEGSRQRPTDANAAHRTQRIPTGQSP